MKHNLIAICISLVFVGFSYAQTTTNDTDEWEISICPVRLIGSGSTDFNGTVSYFAKTDLKGQVIEINQNRKTVIGRFVDLSDFVPCIKSWHLSPAEDHVITFGIGTIHFDRKPNYISVTSKTKKFKIILPTEVFEWSARKDKEK